MFKIKKERKIYMKMKKGISLMVLIVTIIVIIILASVVILTLTKNNPIESAKEATFKNDMTNIQDDIAIYLADQYNNDLINYNPESINLEGDGMVLAIPNTEKYKEKIKIENGKVTLIDGKVTDQEIKWFEDIKGKSETNKTSEDPYQGKTADLTIEVGAVNSSDAIAYLYKIENTDEYDVVVKGKGLIKGYDSLDSDTGNFVGTKNGLNDYEIRNCYILSGITGFKISAFCTAKNLVLPDTVTSISDFAFLYSNNGTFDSTPARLQSRSLPSSFESCAQLKSITLPSSLTSTGVDTFAGCTRLTNIT